MVPLVEVKSSIESSRLILLLEKNGVSALAVSLKDSAYPGVVDRERPFAIVHVLQADYLLAQSVLAHWPDTVDINDHDMIGDEWESAPHPDTVAASFSTKPSAKFSALLSFLVPGLGQFYADRWGAAGAIAATWGLVLFFEPRLSVAVSIIAAIDAYRGCQ